MLWRMGLVGVAGLMAACSMKPPTEAAVRDDQFRPYREVETAPFRFTVQPGNMTMRLVAQIDRQTGAVAALVKIHHNYLGQHRHNYETARNNRAEPLKLSVVARYGNCQVRTNCPLDELYSIEVGEGDLRAAGKAGFLFKVFPRVGQDILVTVPPEMIGSLFALVDQDRSRTTLAARESGKPRAP
jgi:hypothetical protein